jgi:peptidyl-tRNA hydrolase
MKDHNEIIKKQKESYKQSYLDFSKAKVLDIHGEVVSSPPTSAINNDAELRNYISLINTSLKAGINKITIPIEDPEMIKKIRESVNAKPGQLVFHAL